MKQIHFFSTALASILIFLFANSIQAQSSAIAIDGVFNDWTPGLAGASDGVELLDGIDLLEFQVTNDEDFLFIRIKASAEFDLTESTIAHEIRLFLDTDNNASTGFAIQTNYGSELGVVFENLFAHYNANPYSQVDFADFSMRVAPTVSSDEFEIAIRRDAVPDGINPLFTGNTIKVLFSNDLNSDRLPNVGQEFIYTFDETPVAPFVPADLSKMNADHVRIVAYNTLFNGLADPNQLPHLEQVIKALNPDVIGFSEYGIPEASLKALLDEWLPLGTPNGWYVSNYVGGDLGTASRWPIVDSWELPRQFPVLIDLPETYDSDLLFTNSHLACCSNEASRQDGADAYAAFILDAKNPGGLINLAEGTAIAYGGDLNLVGLAQPLSTLVNGDIQNVGTYGSGGFLDWDDTPLTDQISLQSEARMDYTWRNDGSPFPPGKLDFMIYSDAVMSAEHSFILRTNDMSVSRLNQFNLNQEDTDGASDHLPVTVDFAIPMSATACPAPFALNASEISSTGALLSWVESGSADLWEVEILPSGALPSGFPTFTTSDNPVVWNDGLPNESYDFFVRSVCDENVRSEWSAGSSFLTEQDYCVNTDFYDTGGPNADYSDNENTLTVICVNDEFSQVSVMFQAFDVEVRLGNTECWDELYIYDGPDINSPLLSPAVLELGPNTTGGFCWNPNALEGTGNLAGETITSNNNSGCLTFQFTSGSIFPQAGWEASVACSNNFCLGDLDPNGVIDVSDFLVFLSAFGDTCDGCVEDLNTDGIVNSSDLLIMTSLFGGFCE